MQITDLAPIEQQTGDGPPNPIDPTPIDWTDALKPRGEAEP